ncbi:MAG: hypothetical protein CMD13_01250 [Flavobacteriales bacterium]|nr:hypothetical protein [Flavobacteriales bacterium]
MIKLKKNTNQTQYQIKSFKIQIKIFLLIVSVFFFSCDNNKRKTNQSDYNSINIKFERFDKKFFKIKEDSLSSLISEYPYLFPERFTVNDWINIKTDSVRNNIFNKTEIVFNDIKSIENTFKEIFTKTKYNFPDFIPPKIITLNNGIDYKYKIIDSDSIVLISLDCYLGDKLFYKNIPNHISNLMIPEFISIDISELIASRFINKPIDRKFISKIIYHGKLLFLMNNISGIKPWQALGYNKLKDNWVKKNEKNIWEYFIENDLLFSTKSSLDYRFLANAPFSKFGLSIDFESPPMVGRWIGYQIVESYSKQNNIDLINLINKDNYELYLESNYKPKK